MLDDVDLEVAEGTLTAILGASGSGKTTLLRLVIGFIDGRPGRRLDRREGRRRRGRSVHVPPDKRAVGYVAQEGALFPHLTVAENVGFGLPRRERGGRRIDEALDLVGLDRSYGARQPQPALRRRAAPGRSRPGARAAPGGGAARRAVLGARRCTARGDANGRARRNGCGGSDGPTRHPRPGRGALDGPPGGRAPVGTTRADGGSDSALPHPRSTSRWRSSSAMPS